METDSLIQKALQKATGTKDFFAVNGIVNSINMVGSTYSLTKEEISATQDRLARILTEYLFHGDISLARLRNPPPSK